MTDFAYGTNFAGLALILFLCGQVYTARNIIVLVFLILWGLRLALYLFARVLKEGKDARFDDTRDHFFKFMVFWILQCVTVWTISIPFVFLFSRAVTPLLGWQDIVGIIIWVIGFVIEAVADVQKFRFKNQPENRKRMCTIGLWNYSRHPNYFGEALCWWGIWSLCTRAFDADGNLWLYWSVVSPLYVGTILLFLSGIPTLEEPWDKKYGKDADYRRYKKSVPPFIMFIPSLYAGFPKAIKFALCCEFYCLYWKKWPESADGSGDSDEAASTGGKTLVNPGEGGDLEEGWEKNAHSVSYQK